MLDFTTLPHPAPMSAADRATAMASLGFGTLFTDHMVTIDYDEALGGWQTPTVGPRQPIPDQARSNSLSLPPGNDRHRGKAQRPERRRHG